MHHQRVAPPAASSRCRVVRAAAVSPRSMASVSSHGATPPPRRGTAPARRRPAGRRRRRPRPSVSSSEASRPRSSPRWRPARSTAAASRRTGPSLIRAATQVERLRPRGHAGVDHVADLADGVGDRPGQLARRRPPAPGGWCRGGRPGRRPAGATSAVRNRPTSRATTTRRPPKNGGVWAASTTAPHLVVAARASSTTRPGSSSPASSATRAWTASATSVGSSPLTR